MTFRSTQLHFAALALAIVAVSFTGPAARAFTMENLSGNPDGGSRFADPDDQVNGQGTRPFGMQGPIMHFGAQSGLGGSSVMPPFGRYQGFNSGPRPPEPYAVPLGNGD